MTAGEILSHRLSANLSFLFDEWGFLDRFQAAADAGFTCVEFMFPYDHSFDAIAARLAANGLGLSVFNAPPGNWDAGERGLAALAGREAEFERSIATALDFAAAVGADKCHVMAGIADPADARALECYRANLARAAERAGARGLRLLVEPINPFDMPGYFLSGFDAAAAIVAGDANGNLGLQFDIYHCLRIEGAVLDRLAALLPLVAHIQIAGVPGRNEPREPGVPVRAIFELLDLAGYPGRVGCEYRPAAGTLDGLGWIARAALTT